MTLRRLKPQDPSRPTDTRILAVKVAFAEPTPLKLGTTVELRSSRPAVSARGSAALNGERRATVGAVAASRAHPRPATS